MVVIAASLTRGRLSDATGRRKVFVLAASAVFAVAMFVVALAGEFNGFVAGMALSGLGLGLYVAVDLALVVDVLPERSQTGRHSPASRRQQRVGLLRGLTEVPDP